MQPPTKDKELSILSCLFQSAASDHDAYHKITDFFSALVYVFDPLANKLEYINKKITDALGYSYDDLKAGVGLAICKKIIERHGGLIYANSTPEEGSVFSIILPQKQL